jgi:hypothetical protein
MNEKLLAARDRWLRLNNEEIENCKNELELTLENRIIKEKKLENEILSNLNLDVEITDSTHPAIFLDNLVNEIKYKDIIYISYENQNKNELDLENMKIEDIKQKLNNSLKFTKQFTNACEYYKKNPNKTYTTNIYQDEVFEIEYKIKTDFCSLNKIIN